MTDQAVITLDEILAMPDPAAPAATTTTTEATPATPASDGTNRDEHGRFAHKASDAPEPSADVPADPANPAIPPAAGMVPQQALHAAREGERTAKAENDELRRTLQQMQGQISMLSQRTAPQPTPKPAEPAPDVWQDPDKWNEQRLAPIQQAAERQRLTFSRMLADDKFGSEVVTAADVALKTAVELNPALAAEAQRILRSEHPFRELVAWHKDQQTRQRVGSDPDAFVKSELDRLLADPAEAAKILERIQQGANSATGDRSTPPVTKLPPSLAKLPGGANTAPSGGMSNEELFAHATAGMRR